MEVSSLHRLLVIFSACFLVLNASDDVIRDDSDVMLASLFEVNEANRDGTCGKYDLQGLRYAHAVQWFLRTLNLRDYIPGVKIGLETWRMCFSHVRGMDAAFRVMDSYITNSSTQAYLAGVIGPSRTDPAVAVSAFFSSLPENHRVPQISGSATGIALGNKGIYTNFFRVIPPDGAQIKVIRELLVKLSWNYIAIVYTDEEYGRTTSAALRQEVELHNICVPVYASIPTDTSTIEFSTAVANIVEGVNGKAGVSSTVRGAVFIGGRREAQQFAIKLGSRASFVEIIFSEALGLQSSALKNEDKDEVIDVAKGALTVTPLHREVDEFRQAWNQLWQNCSDPPIEVAENVWLRGLKDQYSDCNQLLIGDREQMLFTWYHVQAAAVFAAAIKSLHTDACSNRGPCAKFLSLVQNYEELRKILKSGVNLEAEFDQVVASFKGMKNISFDDRGEVITDSSEPVYEVHNFRSCLSNHQEFCFVKVGSSSGGTVVLNHTIMYGYKSSSDSPKPWQQLDKAQCGTDKDCLECIPIKLCDSALEIPGDFYFVAVAPVHTRDPDDSLVCGQPRANLGADFVEAIQFALKEVNKEGGRWNRHMPGKTLGAIVFDSCYSQLVVKNKLLQLHKGYVMTPTGPMNETHVKNTLLKRIAGYIGGFFSVISFAMSDILTQLDRKAYIHLSPTSVSPGLSDRETHPYFFRLTTPASSEILAMMDMLTTLSATFVQIIYDPVDAYSADLTKEFEIKAAEYGVCVAQKIQATLKSDPSLYARILTQLRQQSSARIVVVILQYEQIWQVMDYLIGDGNHLQQVDNFVFLGSEAWARRPQIIERKQRLAGSITIAEEIAVDQRFTDYFRTVDPLNTTNFWLRDFWEAKENCYFDLSFHRKGRSGKCSPKIWEGYLQDPWVPYYIQAVYAFADGVGKALSETCPREAKDICSPLTSSALVKCMKQVRLDLFSEGSERRVFDDNGDGENGYKLMQAYWDPAESAMKYRQIGTWTVGGRLSLSVSVADLYTKLPFDMQPKNYNSTCSSEVECKICPASKKDKSSDDEEQKLPMIPVVVVIVILVVLLVIAVVAAKILLRRQQKVFYESRMNTEIKFENECQSTLSSLSSAPVQEMYGRAERQFPHDRDAALVDGYSLVFPPSSPDMSTTERPPAPCSFTHPKPDYLTVVHNSADGDLELWRSVE